MKLFYGEKIIQENEHLTCNKNLLYQGEKLLILSETKCIEIPLQNHERLFIWGNIYGILQDNGNCLPFESSKGDELALQKLFAKSTLNEIIQKLEGYYVCCLIKKEDDAALFTDRFNKKDVFYRKSKNEIIASTDLSSVVSKGEKSYDQAALANLLSIYGMYAPKKHTIYKGVRRLGVGEYLSLKHNKPLIEKNTFKPLKTRDCGEKELEKYVDLLEAAVEIRGSKKRNWIYLSSGWDSTTLLALLVKKFGSTKVKAVTGKMEYSDRARDANKFEIERAKKVAEYYSVDFEVIPFDYTTEQSVEDWNKIKPFLRDNHIYADNSCNFYYLSDYIRRNGSPEDAVFCGEISDGAHNLGFSQFTTILEHPVLEFREYSDKMASYLFGPTFLKGISNGTYVNDAVYKLLRSRLDGHIFDDDGAKLNEYSRKSKLIASFFIRNCRIPFYSLKNQKSLTEEGMRMYEDEMFDCYLKECVDNLKPETIYSWILHLYNSFHWQGSTVKSISEMANFNHLNLTLPFWDGRLQDFFSEMPENWGRGLELRPTKYPLKWMLENKIDYPKHLQVGPHSYLYDIDPDFSLEAEILYRSALRPHFQDVLRDYPFEKILDGGYFNIDYYRKLTNDYLSDVEVSGQHRANLYNLVWLCWIGWY